MVVLIAQAHMVSRTQAKAYRAMARKLNVTT
jgi:hypothetical protein